MGGAGAYGLRLQTVPSGSTRDRSITEAGEVRASADVPIDGTLLASRSDIDRAHAFDVATTHVVCTPDGSIAIAGSLHTETLGSGGCVTSG